MSSRTSPDTLVGLTTHRARPATVGHGSSDGRCRALGRALAWWFAAYLTTFILGSAAMSSANVIYGV
jgi:hypothetical protein